MTLHRTKKIFSRLIIVSATVLSKNRESCLEVLFHDIKASVELLNLYHNNENLLRELVTSKYARKESIVSLFETL